MPTIEIGPNGTKMPTVSLAINVLLVEWHLEFFSFWNIITRASSSSKDTHTLIHVDDDDGFGAHLPLFLLLSFFLSFSSSFFGAANSLDDIWDRAWPPCRTIELLAHFPTPK